MLKCENIDHLHRTKNVLADVVVDVRSHKNHMNDKIRRYKLHIILLINLTEKIILNIL